MQIEGRNPVIEALQSNYLVEKLFIERELPQNDKIEKIKNLALQKHLKINYLERHKLNKLSKTNSHQGVILIAKNLVTPSLENLLSTPTESIRLIFIRESFHEHNIGAIIRTAECLGFDGVILPPKISITPNLIRASMGAISHIQVFNYSLFPIIKKLKSEGFQIVGIERHPKASLLMDINFEPKVLLIIGGEDKSLSDSILGECDIIAQIPMSGKINSLNMSVAAAIVMYELSRQIGNSNKYSTNLIDQTPKKQIKFMTLS